MPFDLWRQDDNGQRFLVGRHPTRDSAEQQLDELTRVTHKQTYWIEDVREETEKSGRV
jgi:hypothetical protein